MTVARAAQLAQHFTADILKDVDLAAAQRAQADLRGDAALDRARPAASEQYLAASAARNAAVATLSKGPQPAVRMRPTRAAPGMAPG